MSSMSLLVARVFWLMFGPLLLFVFAVNIATIGNGWLTWPDVVFLVLLAAVIAARCYEFYRGAPQTSTGEPATAEHLRRYVPSALAVGLGVWILANLLGNYWLKG